MRGLLGRKVRKAWQVEGTLCREASGPSWNVKGFLASTAGAGELGGEQEEGNLTMAGGRPMEPRGPHHRPDPKCHKSQ